MPDGSPFVVDPDRERARNPAAHSPVDTRTGAAQHRRGRRAPPLQRQHRILDALGRWDQLLAGGVEAQPLGQAVEEGRPAKTGLERRQTAGDRRLAQPERASGGAHRPFASDCEEHPDIVPVHRTVTRSLHTSRRLMPRFTYRNR
jgi:hypothetical protein